MWTRFVPLITAAWGISEAAMAIARRRTRRGASQDRRSLLLLWIGFTAASFLAVQFRAGHAAPIRYGNGVEIAAAIVFAAGLALRVWAIATLGTRFTVDVRIDDDHELVRRGPYRVLRHPSYTGLVLIVVALGVAMRDWYALAAMVLIPIGPLAYRIRVEEAALSRAFGAKWDEHAAATWRLVPWVY